VFFFNFKGTPSWIMQKTLTATKAQILAMWEGISEASQIVCEVLYCLAPMLLALESVQHIMVWR
jgi:hypothetical protein